MIKAAEAKLERASASCEGWERGCAGIVVAAVIAEFIIAGIHPAYDSFLEQWGSAIADAVIAFGIVGEVLFSTRDGKIQTELRRRSNALLAETMRVTKWREISPETKARLIEAIKPFASTLRIFLEYQNGDMEAYSYAEEIWKIFGEAGAQLAGHKPNMWFEAFSGMAFSVAEDVDGHAILKAFETETIPFSVWGWNPMKMWSIPQHAPRPNVLVNIFPKPPPPRFAANPTNAARETASANVKRE